jgi:hypothetical protein
VSGPFGLSVPANEPRASARSSRGAIGGPWPPGAGVFRAGSDGQPHRPSAFRLEFGAIFNEASNEATQLGILDTHERLCQGQSIGTGKKIVHVGGRSSRAGRPSWGALKKEGNWHLKDLGYVLQLAGTDAVHSLLIFLHLLKRETKRVTELFLANAQHHSTHAHAASHMLVDSKIDVLCHIHHPGDVHSACAIREAANAAERPMFPAISYALHFRQFGRASAPMIPHFVHIKIDSQLGGLSEVALKGFISEANQRATNRNEPLWRGMGRYAHHCVRRVQFAQGCRSGGASPTR